MIYLKRFGIILGLAARQSLGMIVAILLIASFMNTLMVGYANVALYTDYQDKYSASDYQFYVLILVHIILLSVPILVLIFSLFNGYKYIKTGEGLGDE